MAFTELSLFVLLAMSGVAAVAVLIAGTYITDLADRIADRTGFGEAVIGAVLLGAATSLSGTIVSITSALDGRASLAFSNGIGGIAAQTAFLAIADILYRRANLEHAAANIASVFQCAVLALMLSIPLVAYTAPDLTVLSVHPASIVLVLVYCASVYASDRIRSEPMWKVVGTHETHGDEPDEEPKGLSGSAGLFAAFFALMLVLGVTGWVLAKVAGELTDRFGVSASLVGALMTAVVTSLPELVTTLVAVRRGALQLAVGGIIGGNTFDVLFLTLSDFAYRDGSIYHAVGRQDYFWLAIGLVMTSILLIGLIVRQKDGPGRIGFESVLLLAVYAAAVAIQGVSG